MGVKNVAKAWRSSIYTDEKGQRYTAVTVIKDVADCDFQKFFAGELLQHIAETDDNLLPMKNFKKVLHLITRLLSLASKENCIYKTSTELADMFGVSVPTMKRYLKSFQALDLIQNIGAGRWLLNNDIFSQVPAGERKDLVIQYHSVKSKKEINEEISKKQRRLFIEEEADQELAAAARAVNA